MLFKEYLKNINEADNHKLPKIVKFKDFVGGAEKITLDTLKYAKAFRDDIFFNHEYDLQLLRNKAKIDNFYELLEPCSNLFKDAASRLGLNVPEWDLRDDKFFEMDINLDEYDVNKTFAYAQEIQKTNENCLNELIYRKLSLIKCFERFYQFIKIGSEVSNINLETEVVKFKHLFKALKDILKNIK
jgi:hypothetical protein